jgi:cell wall-associated NlpC family hydrolase
VNGAVPYGKTVGRLGLTIAPSTEVYRQRDPRSQLLYRLPSSSPICVKGQQGAYYAVLMIDGSLGWIPATHVQLLNYDVVADTQRPAPPSGPRLASLAGAVWQEAQRYLGVPYLWGGNGHRGIDCSGLVKNVFARCGIALPRTAREQARVGAPVSVTDLRAGDRLYFQVKRSHIDHTGIYLDGGYFIHASLSRGQVAIDHLSTPLYGRHLVDIRRF